MVSLAFFIQVQSVDVSRENLKRVTFSKLVDDLTQEGDLVSTGDSRKVFTRTIRSKPCLVVLSNTSPSW